MKNKYLQILLMVCGLVTLLPASSQANTVLDGVWDNYTLGTTGTWHLSYQQNAEQTLFAIDFDGDFLGNGFDPEVLELVGRTQVKGGTALRAENHSVFGDVSAKISSKGKFKFRASDVPDFQVASVDLRGQLTETSFIFSNDIKFEGLIPLFPGTDHTSGFTIIDTDHTNGVEVTVSGFEQTSGSIDYASWIDSEPLPFSLGSAYAGTLISNVPLPSALLLFVSGFGMLFVKRKWSLRL